MTVRDVLAYAANLTGQGRILADSRALGAIRRALFTVFRDTGCERRTKILAVGSKPITRVKILPHVAGSVEHFSVSGGAYAFEVSGKGGFLIRDKRGERRFSFETDGEFFSGLVTGGGALEFFGEYSFVVFNLSDYPTPASDKELPDGSGERHYDLTELVPDFLSLSSAPTDAAGVRIEGARVVDGVIHLPEEYTGEVYFTYFTRPTAPVVEECEVLDLPAHYAPLVAPLAAAYLYGREDTEISDSCLKIYRDMLATLPRPVRTAPAELYYCKSRWA